MNISVVVPLYNKKNSITKTLQSVANQSYAAKEIIVVNDGSTDGSDTLVEAMGIPNLKLIHQKNAGVSVARNTGFSVACFPWIAFVDGDDEWLPDFLQTLHELYRRFPDYEV